MQPKLYKLRPPLAPRPPARTIAAQLTSGFAMIGTLLGAAFHFGLALFAGWLALGISDPVFSRWSSTWRTGSAWLKHLAHALFN